MMRLHSLDGRILVFVALVALTALSCQADQETSTPTQQLRELTAGIDRIAAELYRTRSFACGSGTSARFPKDLIAVTARQCLSCRDVGHFIRGASQEAFTTGRELWIVVPLEDTNSVCKYLRQEKIVNVPVVSVRSAAFPDPDVTSELIYASYSNSSERERLEHASDGISLLSRLRRVNTANSSAAPTP